FKSLGQAFWQRPPRTLPEHRQSRFCYGRRGYCRRGRNRRRCRATAIGLGSSTARQKQKSPTTDPHRAKVMRMLIRHERPPDLTTPVLAFRQPLLLASDLQRVLARPSHAPHDAENCDGFSANVRSTRRPRVAATSLATPRNRVVSSRTQFQGLASRDLPPSRVADPSPRDTACSGVPFAQHIHAGTRSGGKRILPQQDKPHHVASVPQPIR